MNSPLKLVLSPEIVAQFEAGAPLEQLSAALGRTKKVTLIALRRQGATRKIKMGRPKGSPGKNRLVLSQEILNRYIGGESSHTLAKELGVCWGPVLNALRRQGIT